MVMCDRCRSRRHCAKRRGIKKGDDCGLFVSDKKPIKLPKSHKCSWDTSKGILVTSFKV